MIVGTPFSTSTNSNSTGILLLFVKKNISTDVRNTPGISVTKNDCANGSLPPPLLLFLLLLFLLVGGIDGGGGGGGGGGATRFIVVCVINSPLEKKFANASLIGNSPGCCCISPLTALIPTVLLPFEKLGLPSGI